MRQLEFKFMNDLLTVEELLMRTVGEQGRIEFDLWFIEYITKLKL